MIPESLSPIANHLWQSTLFAGMAGLLTLALRKNSARVRHWVWVAASLKFLIPFSVLIAIGSRVEWRTAPAIAPNVSVVVEQVGKPFTFTADSSSILARAPTGPSKVPQILFGIWACGFIGISISLWVPWRRIAAAVRAGSPVQLGLPIRAISSRSFLEPGVFGVFRPILLLPDGIFEHLTPEQWRAVVVHELSHVRHQDNLLGVVQMFVETVFWFHPLVWWIGRRILEERERACDEEVLRLGGEPRTYAQGILKVCEFYLESPLACVSGVTGRSNLKKRIDRIMNRRTLLRLSLVKKSALAAATIVMLALPVLTGMLSVSRLRAQPQAAPKFDVASIRPNISGSRPLGFASPPGMFVGRNVTLRMLIQAAYKLQDFQVTGGPGWMNSDRYDIQAKAENRANWGEINGSMLRELLADRFQLLVHRETKELPVYFLTVAKSGSKLKSGNCVVGDPNTAPPGQRRSDRCGFSIMDNNMIQATQIDMARFIPMLTVWVKRMVIDKTGFTGTFDVDLKWNPDETAAGNVAGVSSADAGPSIFTAVGEQLGLKLESARGPVEVLTVDQAERPSEN